MLDDKRVILGSIVLGLLPAFGMTHLVVREYKDERRRLAVAWRDRGERVFGSGPASAVVDFETALSYEDSSAVRLRLAEALTAAGRRAEARAHLLTLWNAQPGNGQINLELGRLAAADRNLPETIRYYHAAIDGAWDVKAAAARREARLELANFLVSNGQLVAAQAELIALMDDLPPDPAVLRDVGRLMVRAGADRQALGLFDRALRFNPSDGEAARLAGEVQFRHRDYRSARQYFERAAEHGALDTRDAQERDLSERVLAMDPVARGVSAHERARRVLDCLEIARAWLNRCARAVGTAPDGPLAALTARFEQAGAPRLSALQRDPDLGDQMLSLVFDLTELPPAVCAASSPDEQALQLLAADRRALAR